MIFSVNDRFVEVCGELFPACNIQLYPNLHWDDGTAVFYGIYFELMFESGINLTISQEAVDIANKKALTTCSVDDLDHFLVELTSKSDSFHTYHCVGEEDLYGILIRERKVNNHPAGLSFFRKCELSKE